MQYTWRYASPLGGILLAADDLGLTGLWFEGAKYFALGLGDHHAERQTPVLLETARWLDAYFAGQKPDFLPPLHPMGTDFQKDVWRLLRQIPYGRTATYGEIAAQLAQQRGQAHLSAQAVGGAVGHNRISLLIPCHRVVGADGSLTGYAGGLEKKLCLLALEGVDTCGFSLPTKGTAL